MKPLGPSVLSWCHECNLAILDSDTCPVCHGQVPRINYPFDIRPAFPYDRRNLKKTVDESYGEGSFDAMVPDDRIILFGIAFKKDVGYTVISDGCDLGDYYAYEGKWTFEPSAKAASLMSEKVQRKKISVTSRGISMSRRQKGLAASDVISADPDIVKGDVVFITDDGGRTVSIGKASMNGCEMMEADSGIVVRNTLTVKASSCPLAKGHTWEETIALNRPFLDRAVQKSVSFVRKVAKKHPKIPMTVSLSGGKDSLATLLLVVKAGLRPKIIYADTHMDCGSSGLVKDIAKKYGLEIITYGIPEDALYRNIERLGPPSVDFRWCCKVHQLIPFYILSQMIGGESLTFIGQRRYEGTMRMSVGSEWKNPSVPNQLCASPVQEWNALHIWMFLTREKAPYNKLYEEGSDRIGCYHCPVSPLTSHLQYKWTDPVAVRWEECINEYGERMEMPQVWFDKRLWRYRRLPDRINDVVPDIQAEIESKQAIPHYNTRYDGDSLYSGRPFDPSKLLPLLPIVRMKGRIEGDSLTVGDMIISRDGRIKAINGDKGSIRSKANDIFDISLMATHCLECTGCTFVCKRSALTFKDQGIHLDASKCNGCRKCVEICPAVRMLR